MTSQLSPPLWAPLRRQCQPRSLSLGRWQSGPPRRPVPGGQPQPRDSPCVLRILGGQQLLPSTLWVPGQRVDRLMDLKGLILWSLKPRVSVSASHSPTHPALDLALGRTSLDSLTSLEPWETLLASTEKDNSLEDRWPGGDDHQRRGQGPFRALERCANELSPQRSADFGGNPKAYHVNINLIVNYYVFRYFVLRRLLRRKGGAVVVQNTPATCCSVLSCLTSWSQINEAGRLTRLWSASAEGGNWWKQSRTLILGTGWHKRKHWSTIVTLPPYPKRFGIWVSSTATSVAHIQALCLLSGRWHKSQVPVILRMLTSHLFLYESSAMPSVSREGNIEKQENLTKTYPRIPLLTW